MMTRPAWAFAKLCPGHGHHAFRSWQRLGHLPMKASSCNSHGCKYGTHHLITFARKAFSSVPRLFGDRGVLVSTGQCIQHLQCSLCSRDFKHRDGSYGLKPPPFANRFAFNNGLESAGSSRERGLDCRAVNRLNAAGVSMTRLVSKVSQLANFIIRMVQVSHHFLHRVFRRHHNGLQSFTQELCRPVLTLMQLPYRHVANDGIGTR